MQTASGTLTAAITARERQPKVQLLIDWDNDGTFAQAIDDQSARVESIQIDRTLTTDLPDAVDLLAGYSTATATVTLSGDPTDETKTATWYYSPYSTGSPIYGKRRRWRTVLLALGFAGTAGVELLPAMTGKTRDLSTNGAGKIATLDVFDNFELMRGSIDMPLVVGDDKATKRPGLNSSWVVDYVARRCGFYAAPPPRANAIFHVSFAGSAYPSLGALTAVTGAAGELLQYVPGKWIQAAKTDPAASGYNLRWSTSGGVSTNDGASVLIECWYYPTSFANSVMLGWLHAPSSGVNDPYVAMWVDTSGRLVAESKYDAIAPGSGGQFGGWRAAATMSLNTWHYLAAQVTFTSSGVTFRNRIDGTTAATTISRTTVTGVPTFAELSMETRTFTSAFTGGSVTTNPAPSGGYVEALQVDTYGYGANEPGTGGTPGWNDAFVPTATIQPSLNTLSATVPTQTDAATIVQQIAAAEMATAGFDETGRFTFYTRNRWTSAPYTTSQRTIDASSLKDLTVTEATDQVRNRVRATASPAAVQNAGFIWRTADVTTVPASGSATVTATFDNPATGIATTIAYASSNNPTANYYRANRARDGSGTTVTNLTFTVTLTGTTATIVITNPNAFAVYLVNPPGFSDAQGTPALGLWGRAVFYAQSPVPDTTTPGVTVPTQTVYDVQDATSIGQHGEQLLEIPVNPWLQDGGSLASLVADLLARCKDPQPVITGLSIPYDPRLQLGDRITVIADPFGLSADFFIIGSHVTDTLSSGASQTIDTRAV